MEDTFPASDPPSYSGGNHIVGAPKGRESDSPTGSDIDVVKAAERVKKGEVGRPEKY